MSQRLPVIGSDDGTWGNVLNGFLAVSLNSDGSLATGSVGATQLVAGAITSTHISPTAGITKSQLTATVQTSLSSADTALQSIPSATPSVIGGIELNGDLSGTATSPTLAKINGVTLSTSVPTTGQVLQATSTSAAAWTTPSAAADATATSKGVVQLAGDLSGTAAAPTVPNKLSLSGGTMTGTLNVPYFNSVQVNASPNSYYYADTISLTSTPMGRVWHDLLAFGKVYTTTTQNSLDGVTWATVATSLKLFSQRQSTSTTVINTTYNTYVRWTFSNVAYGLGNWLLIAYAYMPTNPNVSITIQSSVDGTTWTGRHSSAYTAYTGSVWHYITSYGGDTYLRVIIQSTSSNSQVSVASLQLLTNRAGDQGYGNELEKPYTWNETGYMGINKGTSAPSYPLDVTGDANITGQIHNVANPSSAQDVATKNYVDTNTVSQSQLTSYSVNPNSIGIPFVGTNGITITESSSQITIGYSGSTIAISRSIIQITGVLTAASTSATDFVYYWSGTTAYTVTLPTTTSNTNLYTIKNTSTVSQTVMPQSGQTIEGSASLTVTATNSVRLIAAGTNWMVV